MSDRRASLDEETEWHAEAIAPEEVAFEQNVLLVTKARAERLAPNPGPVPEPAAPATTTAPVPSEPPSSPPGTAAPSASGVATIRLNGTIPPEVWNRFGTKVLPKLRSGSDLQVDVDVSFGLDAKAAATTVADLRQALDDLEIGASVAVEHVSAHGDGD